MKKPIRGSLPVFKAIFSAACLSLFIYLFLIIRRLRIFYRRKKSPQIAVLIFIASCSLFFSLIFILSWTLVRELQFVSDASFACTSTLFIFFLIRYPNYFNRVQHDAQGIRYRKSQIEKLNTQKLMERIESLIEEEKIHMDRSVSLKTLSGELDISSSQLSELLNSHHKASFNNFINSHRVEEAKTLLHAKTDVNILEIAFECGFNSKTAFNTAFRKFTGLTPSEYKKQLSS